METGKIKKAISQITKWLPEMADEALAELVALEKENEKLRKELEAEIIFLHTANEHIVPSSIPVLNRIDKLEAALGHGHPLNQIPTVWG